MKIRRATAEDAHILTGIALRTQAFWGYDDSYVDARMNALTVTAEKIAGNLVYLATDGPNIVGFYSLSAEGETDVLDAMYLNPPYIGKGWGRALWDDIIERARSLGIREFAFNADRNTEGFFLKMGAEAIGEAETAAIPERILPLFRMIVR